MKSHGRLLKAKRILIVNCYFDVFRFSVPRKTDLPQAMTPAFLAGVFSPDLCEIMLYNEQYSGPLEDMNLLAWPDMLVLTGLSTAFDRMLHLTAYVRTRNKNAIVVAGGPVIRAIPRYSRKFFDYCCTGDVEQLQEVIEDAFGKAYVSEAFTEKGWVIPRYDLVYWMGHVGYVESSRNCYFRCNFCSLTAEGGEYQQYDLEYLRQQFTALGKQKFILFLDNNFGSTDQQFILDRFELLKDLRKKGFFWEWSALASNDFLLNHENLALSRDSGCCVLFSGVESFDRQAVLNFKKYQNARLPQIEIIRRCLNAGIVFYYGLVFDITTRPVEDLREELDFILNTPEITLPCYISLAIPILGTPFFNECLNKKLFLPNIRLRDLDTETITIKPLDQINEVIQFLQDIQNLTGFKRRVLSHSKAFFRKYRRTLSWWHMAVALNNAFRLCTPKLSDIRSEIGGIFPSGFRKNARTFIGSTNPLDSIYKPAFTVDSRYEQYFKPTMLTDGKGDLMETLRTDLAKA